MKNHRSLVTGIALFSLLLGSEPVHAQPRQPSLPRGSRVERDLSHGSHERRNPM